MTIRPVSFNAATVVGGIAVVLAYYNPASLLGIFGSAIAGILAGNISYGIGSLANTSYHKWCHRSAQAVRIDPKSDRYEMALKAAFERIKNHLHYPLYKKIESFQSDQEAYDASRKQIANGDCNGITKCLQEIAIKNPSLSSPEMLKAAELETRFYFQFLHDLELAFEHRLRIKTTLAAWAPSQSNVQELTELTDALEATDRDLHQSQTSQPFSSAEPAKKYRETLENLVHTPSAELIGELYFLPIKAERREGHLEKIGHVLFIQCGPDKYRFYDSMNSSFYEYKDKMEFFDALRSQVLEDIDRVFKDDSAEVFFRVVHYY